MNPATEPLFLAALFDVSPVGIAIADETGRYVDVNPCYCEMFGYGREELLGRTFGLILVAEQREQEATILAMALANDSAAPKEWQVQARDGRRLTVRSTFRTLRLGDGRPHIITALTDVTALHTTIRRLQESETRLQQLNDHLEAMVAARTASLEESNSELLDVVGQLEETRRNLEEREKAHRLMIDTAHDAVISMDADGRVIAWNRAAEEMFGWSAEEAMGGNLGEMIIPEGYREKHSAGLERFSLQRESRVLNSTVEVFALHRHRGGFPVELSIWPHRMGGQQAFSAFIRDITGRKQAEQEVLEALERAQELADLKSRFVSMASHEFRTPLTVIKSSTDLLLNYRAHLGEADYQRIAADIHGSIERMSDMLDQVLALGSTEERHGSLNPAPLEVADWCRLLADELSRGGLGGERIRLAIRGEGSRRMVDERLLRQAAVNLLTNALKYSPPDMPVEFLVQFEPDGIRFEIADQGIGIPEADQARLFESFFRASNVGQVAGTGLGLAIVRKSVELHGGSLEFASRPGAGSRFWFLIPAR